ncbi:hypothetical protein DN475_32390 [Burkholderia multivorans]|nr:hypothetical protein DN475_32390 [Burkholderia multivorans]
MAFWNDNFMSIAEDYFRITIWLNCRRSNCDRLSIFTFISFSTFRYYNFVSIAECHFNIAIR